MFTFKQLMNWKRYEAVQATSKWNMFDPLARSETTMEQEEWSFCMNNYGALKTAAADLWHDTFLRSDSFSEETWYNEFCLFLAIGVCQPQINDVDAVQKALYKMGFETQCKQMDEALFVVPL